MKVLVAYASRMGSTAEIAERIGTQLRVAGHEVDVQECREAGRAADYGAVVLGSALYLGRWDRSAVAYLRRQAGALAERPTWLFQSGPCGKDLELEKVATPRAVRRLTAGLDLGKPVTFGGRLDQGHAGTRLQRWMATGAYAGDFRDWDQVSEWTRQMLPRLAGNPPHVVPVVA